MMKGNEGQECVVSKLQNATEDQQRLKMSGLLS